jgi:hypothetical protein
MYICTAAGCHMIIVALKDENPSNVMPMIWLKNLVAVT